MTHGSPLGLVLLISLPLGRRLLLLDFWYLRIFVLILDIMSRTVEVGANSIMPGVNKFFLLTTL